MTRAPLSENILRCFCEFAAAYVLLLQAIGLLNLFRGSPLFNGPTVLVCTACLLAGLIFRCRRLISARIFPAIPFRLPFLMLGLAYGLFLADALTSYPDGYDPIAHHLKAVSWLQSSSPLLTDFKWQMAIPANTELFTLPALALNLQNLVFWGNLLATVILGLSVYVVARHLSGSREAGAFSCLIVLSVPIVIFQTFYLDTDAFATAFALAALAFLLIYLRDNQPSAVILSALCAGICIGNKQVFVPYAGLILLVAILTVMKRKQLISVPVLIALGLAPSALWFCRNWASTGNPFFPFPVHFLGHSLRGATGYGFILSKVQVNALGAFGYTSEAPPIGEFKGVGAVFSTFAIGGFVAAVLESLRKRRTVLIAALALTMLVGSGWWLIVHVVRMGLPVLAMIAAFAAILYEGLLPRHRRIARGLLTVGVAATCLLCVSVQMTTLIHRLRSRDWSRAAYYGYPGLIDQLPAGTTILDRSYDGRMQFAFAGQRLQNKVMHFAGPLDAAEMSAPAFQYAIVDGPPNDDDRVLAQFGDLIYDGFPATIFPKTALVWRIYRIGRQR